MPGCFVHLCTVKTVIWQICSNRPGKKVPQSARLRRRRRKGADPILWGRWETEEEWEECEENESEMGSSKEGGAQESKMRRKPPTSSKQLRKLGEPNKKMGRIEEDSTSDADIPPGVFL